MSKTKMRPEADLEAAEDRLPERAPTAPAGIGGVLALVVCSALATAFAVWLAGSGYGGNDYDIEIRRGVEAIATGDLRTGLGSGLDPFGMTYVGSIVLRAPFLWLAGQLGAEDQVLQVLGSTLGYGTLAAGLVLLVSGAPAPPWRRAAGTAAVLVTPLVLMTARFGHPEDLMALGLCLATIWAIFRGHSIAAGMLYGAAVACKPWTAVLGGAILVLLPRNRALAVAAAFGVAAAVLAPAVIVNGPAGLLRAAHEAGSTQDFKPNQLFWFLGSEAGEGRVVIAADGTRTAYRYAPGWFIALSHPAIVLIGCGVGLLWGRRRRRTREQALLLVALLLHIRCFLDPWNVEYYAAGMIVALCVWGMYARNGSPMVWLLHGALLAGLYYLIPSMVSIDVYSLLYLAWLVPFTWWIARMTFRAPAPGFVPVTSGAPEGATATPAEAHTAQDEATAAPDEATAAPAAPARVRHGWARVALGGVAVSVAVMLPVAFIAIMVGTRTTVQAPTTAAFRWMHHGTSAMAVYRERHGSYPTTAAQLATIDPTLRDIDVADVRITSDRRGYRLAIRSRELGDRFIARASVGSSEARFECLPGPVEHKSGCPASHVIPGSPG